MYPSRRQLSRSVRSSRWASLATSAGALVADVRCERRDEHERALHILRHFFPVRADTGNAPLVKGRDGRRKKARRLQKVINAHRQEHIQLKIPLRCGKAHGGIVAQHLHCRHRDLLALRGVDLARHDRRARFILRNADFSDARSADLKPASARRLQSSSGLRPAPSKRRGRRPDRPWP